MNKATNEAVKTAETMVKDAQDAFQTNYQKMTKSFEDMTAFGKENLDAVMKSNEISAKAAEEFGKKVTELSKTNFDESVKAAQELSSVKTVNELVEKQTAFAKTAFETFTKQMTELNEFASKSAKDVYAPLSTRVDAASDFAKTLQA